LTRPPSTEGEATGRAIALAAEAKAPLYIVHVTCKDALEHIVRARARGQRVFGETCPQYLFLSIDDLRRPGFEGAKYVLTPPLRDSMHQDELWNGLIANDLQVVATDHCPFNFSGQKEAGRGNFTKIPNGGPGVENRMELLFHHGVRAGRFDERRWVELTATAPAKIFGLGPRKGTLAVGSDADLVLWDPAKDWTISAATHRMHVDYSLYEGFTGKGKARTVIVNGEVIMENGEWKGRTTNGGHGRFIAREPFGTPYN
jgi:dihydropyrimidinase